MPMTEGDYEWLTILKLHYHENPLIPTAEDIRYQTTRKLKPSDHGQVRDLTKHFESRRKIAKTVLCYYSLKFIAL